MISRALERCPGGDCPCRAECARHAPVTATARPDDRLRRLPEPPYYVGQGGWCCPEFIAIVAENIPT